ncbi:MAG: hypothetical protein U0174_24365 [Polyangiaceae bacterium]
MLRKLRFLWPLGVASLVVFAPSCSSSTTAPADPNAPFTGADIGPEGGEVVGLAGSDFAGIRLKIPAGALSAKVRVSFQGVIDDTPLPETAERVGPAVKLLPEGTQLTKPAELTLPLDREMVGAYAQTPAGCKVWSREGAGWQRTDQIRSDSDTITIPISKFTTAAAGVNFLQQNSCVKTQCEPVPVSPQTFQSLDQLCQPIDGAPFCLIKLPLDEKKNGIDEFSSLNIKGRKVYWAASFDGNVTVARYDLDRPSDPLFKYPAYTGSTTGTVANRGIVGVPIVNSPTVWMGFSGIGNVLFNENVAPVVFDSGSAAGVVVSEAGEVRRFRRQNVVNNGLVSKTDIRVYREQTNDSKFVFNFPITPSESIVGFGIQSQPPHMYIRSVHRGAAKTFLGTQLSDFMVFDAQDGNPGVSDDNDPATFGAIAFNGGYTEAAIVKGSRVERRKGTGFKDLVTSYGPPGGIRDVAFDSVGVLYGVSSNEELYVMLPNGGLQTYRLPEAEIGMVPWRLRNIPGTRDLLLVTRGSLLQKGSFYIIRPAVPQ